jgi:hypothetical protein
MDSLDVRKEYACARPFSRALHLDRFEQPGISCIALRVQLETPYTNDKGERIRDKPKYEFLFYHPSSVILHTLVLAPRIWDLFEQPVSELLQHFVAP